MLELINILFSVIGLWVLIGFFVEFFIKEVITISEKIKLIVRIFFIS